MQYISTTKLFNVVPLDILLHITIGYIVYIGIKNILKLNYTISYIVILALEILKEFIDSFSMTNTLEENIKDFIATMLIPTTLLLIKRKKNKNKLN